METMYLSLKRDRDELGSVERARAMRGGQVELTEWERELRRRLGLRTSALVDAEQKQFARRGVDEVDCIWDEEDEYLLTFNIFPQPPLFIIGDLEVERNARFEHHDLNHDDTDQIVEVENDDVVSQNNIDAENDIYVDSDDSIGIEFNGLFDDDVEIDFNPQFEEDEIDPDDRRDTERMVRAWRSSTLPLPAGGEGVMCVYCQYSIEESSEATQLPYCSHIFHRDCIVHWLTPRIRGTRNRRCPACRRSVYTPPPSP